jgi:N-acetylglucosaminyldiphosphoundecaprenol N-acetyl-beta-D-mannosaminyltransferase
LAGDADPVDGRRLLPVLGAPIDVTSSDAAIQRIRRWAHSRESRYVCVCNVHSVVTAGGDPAFMAAIAGADMAVPDGAPVAWMLRRGGAGAQHRVSGPDLMAAYFEQAANGGESVFLYGNTQATLDRLVAQLHARWPGLAIAGALSPPFRALTPAEDDAVVSQINDSGAGTVWVSLGCPKQEHWMAAHSGRIQAVMLGVGAAFDFHAGTLRRAPLWMRRCGLEWLHRLLSEPRRLAWRYLSSNTRFVIAVTGQWLRGRR